MKSKNLTETNFTCEKPGVRPTAGPTQLQMFYREQRNIAEANQLFLDMVKDGMTRQELQAMIDRMPGKWGRFSNWLNVLPEKAHD
jgi:hypothetical protein